jgi:hypothetical protein
VSQFYISAADPQNDVRRCRNALISGTPITISGANDKGEIRTYTGVVQSVEDQGERVAKAHRWRITILDTDAN